MQFKLPELGEGVNEGELVNWLVKEGDSIKDDQPLCEIMTDKATIEIPSPTEGKVTALHAKEGDVVMVGEPLISFDGAEAGAAATSSSDATETSKKDTSPQASTSSNDQNASESQSSSGNGSSKPAATSSPAASMSASGSSGLGGTSTFGKTSAPTISVGDGHSVQAAPSTRKFAREAGVDLGRVSGSGPHGRILREDVERFLTGGGMHSAVGSSSAVMIDPSSGFYPSGGEERVPFKGLRKKIAQKMRESKDKAAHFTYVEEADATELVRLRKQAKEIGAQQGVKVTFLPFVMKAMVAALRKYPILNSTLDEERNELVYRYFYNIGLSIQTDEGLTAPVIRNVEQKSVLQLASEIQDLVSRAREKKLTIDDFKEGTITLTNAGSIGGLFATPVINFPEVAILGFNKIEKKPVVKTIDGKDEIVIRDWTLFSISLDHRIVDGAIGAEFMKLFIQYIENPSLLIMA